MKTVFNAGQNSYDVFLGNGWSNRTRIQWKDKQWTAIAGDTAALKQAVWTFTNSRKGM